MARNSNDPSAEPLIVEASAQPPNSIDEPYSAAPQQITRFEVMAAGGDWSHQSDFVSVRKIQTGINHLASMDLADAYSFGED